MIIGWIPEITALKAVLINFFKFSLLLIILTPRRYQGVRVIRSRKNLKKYRIWS
jgi:hypothetical protein